MWTWTNCAGGLFLQTSNMSEKAVGYMTIGGDVEGALSVIANVPKTVVNYLLDCLLETTGSEGDPSDAPKPRDARSSPRTKKTKASSCRSRCSTRASPSYAGEKMAPPRLRSALARRCSPSTRTSRLDAWAERFVRLFTQCIYKWVQAPLALHVGNLDLDRERALQLPVVQKTEW